MVSVWSVHVLLLIMQLSEFTRVAGNTHSVRQFLSALVESRQRVLDYRHSWEACHGNSGPKSPYALRCI
jgi:hypothetical protein